MLCVRNVSSVRPCATRPQAGQRLRVVVRADPKAEQALQTALKEAEDACEGDEKTGACAAAWDNVEEVSAAISHKKQAEAASNSNDPLEKFCGDNPDADECRVYED